MWGHTNNANTKAVVQRRTTKFVVKEYPPTRGVLDLLHKIKLDIQKEIRLKQRITFIHRIINELVRVESFRMSSPNVAQ